MEDWLHSYVDFGQEQMKRGQLFKYFLEEGIVPFINSMGYTIGTPTNVLYGGMVSGLYENRGKSTMESVWNRDHFCEAWNDDDRLHYYHVIDPDTWDKFWKTWNFMEDFSDISYHGQDRRMDIEQFIWRQLDLENSYQTEILYGEMTEEDETEHDESSKKVDVYLLEAAGWGGLRR